MSVHFLRELTALPRAAYESVGHFEAELARLFRARRCFALHTDRLSNVGAWACIRVGGQELIVARKEDGAIRAYANRCIHNGDAILERGTHGNSRLIRCPHHGWTYGLDGALMAGPGFNTSGRATVPRLPEISSAVIGSLLIVGPESRDGMAAAGTPGSDIGAHDDDLTLRVDAMSVRANWKFVVGALCRRGWTYALPNLAMRPVDAGTALARIEPLGPGLTSLEVGWHVFRAEPEAAGVDWAALISEMQRVEVEQPSGETHASVILTTALESAEQVIRRAEGAGGLYRPLSDGL
jgi:nitrite reductase/ring-hydroxylating ferredoxin subunit